MGLARNEVGVIILAGSEYKEGFDGPKGIVNIGLLSQKCIFHVYADRIRRMQHLVQQQMRKFNREIEVTIPVYILVSEFSSADIQYSFDENNYFGLNPKDVGFMIQENT